MPRFRVRASLFPASGAGLTRGSLDAIGRATGKSRSSSIPWQFKPVANQDRDDPSRRCKPMAWLLTIVLFMLPGLEFWLMISLGFTLPLALFEGLVTAGVGWWFARQEELSLWMDLESDVQNHRVPTEEGLDAMLGVLGGWCLIVPGLITDLAGVVLVFPALRMVIVPYLRILIRDHFI